MSTVAGTGVAGFSGEGGPATAAQLGTPIGVSFTTGGGFLLSAQGNSRIRRVLPDGNIVTVAGNGSVGFSGDGDVATNAQLNGPIGVALAPDGSTLFADANNNRVRAVNPAGIITTVVGAGGGPPPIGDGGAAFNATLAFPAYIAFQPDGGYLIADNDNKRIRRVAPDGTISTVAGNGGGGSTGDGGPATSAQLADPSGVAVTPDGGFVISELVSHRVRKVGPDGIIGPVAGTGTPGFNGDGIAATGAALNQPNGLVVTADGSVLIADTMNHRIRRVAPDGTIGTIVGTGTGGFNGDGALGPATQLNQPFDAEVTPEGDILIADTVNHRVRILDSGAPPPPPVPASLTLDPASADRRPGDANVVTATARNNNGTPAAGRTIAWRVVGPNETTGTATTDPNGVAQITWDGVREGSDALTAFVDIDGNAAPGNPAPGPGEPTATATVNWALPAPVQGRVYNLEPVSGIVRIRIVRRRGKGVHGAGSSAFQRLEEAQQVNFDTIVDVRRGRVRMTTASSRQAGDIQKGEFYGGVYTSRQPRTGRRPVTELRLSESLICQRNSRGKLTTSRARSRKLWGNGRGRFRTRGRHSAATVRGTIWLTKDTCNTTTTVVREGVVTVRDLVKRRNVNVRAGRRYTARARRR